MIKIYLIDDEQLIIDELLKIIDWNGNGYKICGYANDAKTALKDIAGHRPSLLICDIGMSGMDGLTLVGEVLKFAPETAVIFLTAYDKFDYAVEAIRLQAVAYLMKPVRTEELTDTLKKFRNKKLNGAINSFMEMVFSEKTDEEQVFKIEKLLNEYGLIRNGIKYAFLVFDEKSEVSFKQPVIEYSHGGRTIILAEEESIINNSLSDAVMGGFFQTKEKLFVRARQAIKLYDKSVGEAHSDTGIKLALNWIIEEIKENCSLPFSLSNYAKKYHYNISYLSEKFKEHIGMNFVDYLMSVRFEKVKVLMRKKNLNMKEIALQVGYEDYSHFSKLFKKNTGFSPVDYRKAFY